MALLKKILTLHYKILFYLWCLPLFSSIPMFITKIPYNKQLRDIGGGAEFGDFSTNYNPVNHTTSYFEALLWIIFMQFLIWIPLKIIAELIQLLSKFRKN